MSLFIIKTQLFTIILFQNMVEIKSVLSLLWSCIVRKWHPIRDGGRVL